MTYPLDRMVEASKRFGLRVEVVPGAETRSAGSFNPHGFVGHHTAGAKTGVRPSLALCVNGRSDLSGPLCNDFLDRNGVDVIVACGRANHAGLGGFRGIVGNSGVWGCEAEDDGDGVWTPAQLDAYPRLVAARLWLLGRDASWYCSHRTWALTPPSWPGRKTDPAGITDEWMRARVAPLLAAGSAGATVTPEDELPEPKDVWAYGVRNDKSGMVMAAGERLVDVESIAAATRSDVAALKALVAGEAVKDAARDAALAAAVEQLKASGGAGVDLGALSAAMVAAAEQGSAAALSRLDVILRDPEPAPEPTPTA